MDMMKKLGLRGSASKEGRLSSSPPFPSSNTVTVGSGKPLRLVYCDEKGKFCMDPEAVHALQLVKGPIGVVSVCGRARQGKSFILNQLLGQNSGFQVASTHRPCTKGLWMWSAPLKRTAIDGTEYHLLLLDSEGIDAYDQTGTYSTQIFSLAILLSSMFIYNQMGGIDEAALDRLSLVTEMTKHIRVRASGGKTTASELGQFSPVFIWLLRDFYLDLVEDNHKITPRDYLELALRPMQGGGKNMKVKNEIRESIRALFPDRECFTLVRPLNDERDLQRLDQICMNELRPEFRSGIDALTKFVLERTKPKQVEATIMTGSVLVGITQSFLDAINDGAVPTISSSWQSVEEAECRKAYESATEAYMSSFDRTKPPEEDALREAHEFSVQKSVAVFNSSAVGAGAVRQKYENFLKKFFSKAFEDYKRTAYMEADLRCSNAIQSMEKKLRASCIASDAKVDHVINVLDGLFSEYEGSSHGPAKWKKLANFLLQCLEGPLLDLFKKQLDQICTERSNLALKCHSNEEKMEILKKQIEASENYKADYLKRYEETTNDKKKMAEEYTVRIANLQSKCSLLEERCLTVSRALESAKLDSSEWKSKYDHISLKQKAEENQANAEITSLKSRASAAEARVAAIREQANGAQEEASEWKQKFEIAVSDVKMALQKAARIQEQTQREARRREDALRIEFAASLSEKEDEFKEMKGKVEQADHSSSRLSLELKAVELKLKSYNVECSALRLEVKELHDKLDSTKATCQSYEQKTRILEQDKMHLEQKYQADFRRFEEADERYRAAETETKRATELSDKARKETVAAQKEKSEMQHVAMERLAQLKRNDSYIESLERERANLKEEVDRLHISKEEALSKVALLEAQVEEREKEIESLLKSSNEQRASTIQVLEGLLSTERKGHSEANKRAEDLSSQLQSTQGRLDALQQELMAVRLNETVLDSKLRVSHGKRVRVDEYGGLESVDEQLTRGRKKSKSSMSPSKTHAEDGASFFTTGGGVSETLTEEPEDHTKFTVQKLKQELTKHGFGAEFLQLKNPPKKDVVALYEKHILHR